MSQHTQSEPLYPYQRILSAFNIPTLSWQQTVLLSLSVSILVHTLFAIIKLLVEVFTDQPGISFESTMFETVIISFVFLYGVGLLYAVVYAEPGLSWLMTGVAVVLVAIAFMVLIYMSNRCILGDQCSVNKFGLGLIIVTVFSAVSPMLVLLVGRGSFTFISPHVFYFVILYILAAAYQSHLLLLKTEWIHVALKLGPVEGLLLFLFTVTIIIIILALTLGQPAAAEPPEP